MPYLVDNSGASEAMDKLFGSRNGKILLMESILRLNHHRTLRHTGPVKSRIHVNIHLYYQAQ